MKKVTSVYTGNAELKRPGLALFSLETATGQSVTLCFTADQNRSNLLIATQSTANSCSKAFLSIVHKLIPSL